MSDNDPKSFEDYKDFLNILNLKIINQNKKIQ
jgi:hypothetical protein